MNDTTTRTCSTCGIAKPLTEFYPRKSERTGRVVGHVARCRACIAAVHKAKYDADPVEGARKVGEQRHRRERLERHVAQLLADRPLSLPKNEHDVSLLADDFG